MPKVVKDAVVGGGVGGAAAGDRQPRHQVLHLRPGAEHHMPGLGQVNILIFFYQTHLNFD